MNKDAKRKYRYFVFFNTLEDEIKTQVYNKQVSTHFLEVKMQSSISFPVKVNQIQATTILDIHSRKIAIYAKDGVSNSNGGLKIIQIGWLSKVEIEKLYESLVIYLANKNQVEALLGKRIMKIRGETAFIEVWQEVSLKEKRFFNCQEYRYKAGVCVKIPVCGNYFIPGHLHY